MKKIKVGLIFGGKSGEHEVSIISASSIVRAFDKNKYEVVEIKVDKNNQGLLEKFNELRSIDVFFPIMHGTYGEDGALQGVLEWLNKPYIGPGVLGSAAGMDKDVMKRLLRDAGLPIGKFYSITKETMNEKHDLEFPIFVKPANLGSSVGISKAKNENELKEAITLAFKYDTKVLLEEYIRGREIEVSVLGNDNPKASLPGEIIPTHEFYSYDAKYIDEQGARFEIPAKLSKEKIKEVQALAVKVFKTLECFGMGRVDFFLAENDTFYVNEINTLPGFTSISMYPKMWEASGLPYPKLLEELVHLAIERFEEKKKLKRDFKN